MSLQELEEIVREFTATKEAWGPSVSIDRIRSDFEDFNNRYPAKVLATVEAVTARGVPSEWILADGATADGAILHLHGGGFVVGSIRSHRPFAIQLSAAAGAPVLLVGYRLAPEHTFPAQLEDAVSAYRSLLDRGLPASRIAISGDSAGGGLAVAVMLALRERGFPLPGCGVLISPWADMACSGQTYFENGSIDPIGTREMAQMMAAQYLGEGGDHRDPLASPVLADLAGLPPLFILAGTREIFLDDARTLASHAERDRVQMRFEIWPGMIHQWPLFASALEEGRRALSEIGSFIQAHIADRR